MEPEEIETHEVAEIYVPHRSGHEFPPPAVEEAEAIEAPEPVKVSIADLVAIYQLQKAGFTAEDFA